MFSLIVTIKAKAEHREEFIEAMLENARSSARDEPGCLRFDVVQDGEDPNRLHLYELYRDEAAFEAHRQTPHFLRWWDTVRDWLDGPLARYTGHNLIPADESEA